MLMLIAHEFSQYHLNVRTQIQVERAVIIFYFLENKKFQTHFFQSGDSEAVLIDGLPLVLYYFDLELTVAFMAVVCESKVMVQFEGLGNLQLRNHGFKDTKQVSTLFVDTQLYKESI